MREIKLRGKQILDDTWVYGTGVTDFLNIYYKKDNRIFLWALDYRWVEIDPKTLAQSTGLKDKNGVEIYEGDIVHLEEDDEDSCMGNTFKYIGVVSYGNSLKISRYVSQYPTSFCVISKSFYMEQALLHNSRWLIEVIGNIHENPKLLDTQKD